MGVKQTLTRHLTDTGSRPAIIYADASGSDKFQVSVVLLLDKIVFAFQDPTLGVARTVRTRSRRVCWPSSGNISTTCAPTCWTCCQPRWRPVPSATGTTWQQPTFWIMILWGYCYQSWLCRLHYFSWRNLAFLTGKVICFSSVFLEFKYLLFQYFTFYLLNYLQHRKCPYTSKKNWSLLRF